jgi:hypothetical protein
MPFAAASVRRARMGSYTAILTCAVCGKPLPETCVFLGWNPFEGSIYACPSCATIDEQEATDD